MSMTQPKPLSSLLVTALMTLFAASLAPSCASGGTATMDGSGGDSGDGSGGKGSGGSSQDGSGGSGSGSGGKVGSGGSSSSGGSGDGSGGKSSSGGSGSSSGGKTGSGGSGSGTGGKSSSGGTPGTGTGGNIITGTGTGGSGNTSGGGGSGAGPAMTCTAKDATMTVSNGMATNGMWTGYAYTYASGTPSSVAPMCGTSATCYSNSMAQLCAWGSVGPDTTYAATAGFGWNISSAGIAPGGTGLAYDVMGLTTSMRLQVEDGTNTYCANVTTATKGTIPWKMFKSKCYDATPGAAYDGTSPITKVGIIVPSNNMTASAFCFCVLSLGPAT